MQKLGDFWLGLGLQRQIIVAAATVGVFLAVLGIARMASSPAMSLLYAGLDPVAAGEVIQALDARNVRYRVQGDAIYVSERVRDETRLQLAARSLPANGAAGYELLDTLSGFGTTSQMFDAAYWRAKEGELARTIATSPGVRGARVHIAQGNTSPFRREAEARASVTVTSAGGGVSATQARAIRFLVASAVAGLDAGNVSVIDAESGLVAGGTADPERDEQGQERSAALRRNVERLLVAHVGHGRAVVEVSIDLVTDHETIVERRIDPETRVAISTESEERVLSANDTRAQGVTVASNLPDGDAAENDGRSESRESETRERANFEVSETQREVLRAPGAIRRLGVAVLVDGHYDTDAGSGAEWRPRSAEELAALHTLVESAVGYDAARGDQITVQSLRFEPVAVAGTDAIPSSRVFPMPDPLTMFALGALLLLALALAIFVVRPILLAARTEQQQAHMLPPGAGRALALGSPADASEGDALTGEIEDTISRQGAAARGQISLDDAEDTDPVARLRRLITERQQESVEILRHWMEDKENPR